MRPLLTVLILAGLLQATAGRGTPPIALHPDNPHYFQWRGRPTALITSAEHYGAVLNLDFDYRRYLETLRADGMNYTRIFSGAYVEPRGAFNIARNTLAPEAGRFICPWARSDQPGYANGGNRFDLSAYDPAYFERLRDFVAYAGEQGVVVELALFCPMYEEKQWALSPMNPQNNIQGLGEIARTDVYTLDRNGGLLEIQLDLVRTIVTALNGFDNLFYEIANEPYFGGITLAWQHRVADVILETEAALPHRHLIAQNIANNTAIIESPHPGVSIFNFHYATPPDAVTANYHLGKVIGDDETGFRGTADTAYRTEAWDFMLAGGGLFNNLDYSFTAGHEDGIFAYPDTQPGGGNREFRRQIRILSEFIHGFDFVRMKPDNSVVRGGVPASGTARALVDPERAIAVYIRAEQSTGPWSARWTGSVVPPVSGDYTFSTYSNDGIRLWIDGRKIIDDWTDHGEKEDSGNVQLTAGRPVELRLEYFYNGGQGATKLWWAPPGGDKVPVPNDVLRLPTGGWGLHGEYFRGTDLKRPMAQRDDGQVNFAWGVKPPFSGAGESGQTTVRIALPPGTWQGDWVNTLTGDTTPVAPVAGGRIQAFEAPAFRNDIALRLVRSP